MKITEHEMRGLLAGKCLPGDMRVNEELPAYLLRKFDELQQKLDALADKLARSEDYSVGVDTERMEYIKKCNALAAENVYLKDSIAMHAAGFSECSVCGNEESCETHDIVWMAKETPATDAYLNSVRAEGVEMFGEHCINKRAVRFWPVAGAEAKGFAERLRSGTHDTTDKAG